MARGDEDADPIGELVGRYRGSGLSYVDSSCTTGRCPRIEVTELPYERQIDEPDGPYHARLYERFMIALSHRNYDEIAAIRAAVQMDIGIPEDGLHVPCRDEKEWLVWAYIQGVKPDAWLYAERITHDSEEDAWFTPGPGQRGFTLWQELNQLFEATSLIGSLRFIGPDGILYNMQSRVPEIGGIHGEQNRSLVGLLRDTSQELGVSPLAALEHLHRDIRPVQYGFQTTEPPLRPLRSFLFEYETLRPSGVTDHGENVRLAQGGPVTSDAIPGPFGQPSGLLQRNIGAMPRGWGTVIVHNGRGGPFGSLYRDGLNEVLRREGLGMGQFNALRQSDPGRYRAIRQRAQQSMRLRVPGVRADMRGATIRGEQVVRQQGGQPNYHDYRADLRSGPVYVRPDGFRGAQYNASGRVTGATHVVEVKHVAYQAYTQQIQGQVRLAQDIGARFELIVLQRTVLSGTLNRAITAPGSNITLTRIP